MISSNQGSGYRVGMRMKIQFTESGFVDAGFLNSKGPVPYRSHQYLKDFDGKRKSTRNL